MNQALYRNPRAYDILYQHKDYEGEVEFVLDRFREHGNDGGSALVVGCGTGNHSRLLQRSGFDVLGIDPNAAMLDRAREKSSATFRAGALPDIELNRTFDLVWVPYTVVDYLELDTLPSALATLTELVAADGLLVVDTGDFHELGAPGFQLLSCDEGSCARLFQYHRVDADHVRMDALVFLDDEWFFDRHTLLDVPDESIAEAFRARGFTVETADWYGTPTAMDDPTVFVAYRSSH
ncbi:class I SAM-dependent methyltransferase (plasmid) [Haladaptatus sp. SPP-AMP-3]|uniref:class I SAM-dependent methyltransferase n=1 Tax=Haladaptatus sp. SPP-AMP-3 TaxID=3121295 RepID=UPI003C2B62B0